MKILILGSTGMIGHKIHQVLSRNKSLRLFNISKSQLNDETIMLDLRNFDDLQSTIQMIKPDVVVNAAGILIEESELKPIDSIQLNAILPLRLSDLSNAFGFKLIQISTDCVFSGKNGPYSVSDVKDASSIYGRAKALGEVYDVSNLTIRTSVIGPDLGADGKELFNWFMNQSGEINGFCKSMWSGVTTLELAKCVEYCILNGIIGLNHLTSGTSISKHDLLKLMNQQCGKELEINRVDGPINNKVLLAENYFFYTSPQSYSELLTNMIADICESKIYSHYEFNSIRHSI
jgi:dTDP-4-dehydrorhamnose reductase